MAHSVPTFYARSIGDASSAKSSLLTPPLSPLHPEDQPFRPSDDDRVSLNLKKSHHSHQQEAKLRDQNGSLYHTRSDNEHNIGRASRVPTSPEIVRSLSLNFPPRYRSQYNSPQGIQESTSSKNTRFERSRRWTLPSKSEATRGLAAVSSTVKQSMSQDSKESPAIITLRRATTNKAPKKLEYVSFPEPKFSHDHTGLVSFFVATFSRATANNGMPANLFNASRRSSKSTSTGGDGVHPAYTFPAATVQTEITVDANLAMPGYFPIDSTTIRRCSTRYSSGDNIYEVIWDENDSSSNADTVSGISGPDRRRSSLAAMRLEAQLNRSDESSRRSSADTGSPNKPTRSSVDLFPEQNLTSGRLESLFPRLLHKTGLRDLPRSRGGRKRKSTTCNITINETDHETLRGDGTRRNTVSSMDFFPPLPNRRASHATQNLKSLNRVRTESPPRQRNGSMIGWSGHARRRSSAFPVHASPRPSVSKALATGTIVIVSEDESGDSDTQPLISKRHSQALNAKLKNL